MSLKASTLYYLYFIFSSLAGFFLGIFVGFEVGECSHEYMINETYVYLFILIIGGMVVYFLGKLVENNIVLFNLKKDRISGGNSSKKMYFLPFMFFLYIGVLVGMSHVNNINTGKHCLLPINCPEEFCILRNCF